MLPVSFSEIMIIFNPAEETHVGQAFQPDSEPCQAGKPTSSCIYIYVMQGVAFGERSV